LKNKIVRKDKGLKVISLEKLVKCRKLPFLESII